MPVQISTYMLHLNVLELPEQSPCFYEICHYLFVFGCILLRDLVYDKSGVAKDM